MSIDPYEVVVLAVGVVVLLAAWLPGRLRTQPLSLPIVLVGVGAVVFSLPVGFAPDRVTHGEWFERSAELGVLVSLMGAGLKLDRPLGWRSWGTTWRLLGLGLPLTVVATAAAGLAIGLPLAAAVLLGAVLSPTDPVLAAEVQVSEPSTGEAAGADGPEDEVRFSLTSEAGLNDGLAFPFVYAALALAGSGGAITLNGVVNWLVVDVGYRLGAGVLAGWAVGRALSWVIFSTSRFARLADTATGFVALAATLIAYGVTELVHGYGFIAVFVAALTIRSAERSHRYHNVLHDFADEIEQLLVIGLLILMGGAMVSGLFSNVGLMEVAVGFAVVLVIRPVVCWIALAGGRTSLIERRTVAFFGIRGIGSFYYLAYAATSAEIPHIERLWTIVAVTVLLSVVIHGTAATPVMRRLDRLRRRRRSLR